MGVRFGIDQLLAETGRLEGRIGLVTNDAALTASNPALPGRLALQKAGFRLVRLYSPEHGLQVRAADGTPVADSVDAITGLPIVSLYGERLRPTAEQLADLDVVLFDVPDIGARFYTYIWTLAHVLEACAEAGKPLVVLDRPNPLGGRMSDAEGPLLDMEHCSSFLGRAAIPIRHSLTAGELALLWNQEWKLGAQVQVVACPGWNRAMHWPDTGLPFVPTSPAMPSYESALLYPGLCLFEATNLGVGRGTALPFQVITAPWLRAEETAARFNSFALPGVRADSGKQKLRGGDGSSPAQWTSGRPCGDEPSPPLILNPPLPGVKVEVCALEWQHPAVWLRLMEPKLVRPVAVGLHLLAAVIDLHPRHFSWVRYPTVANPSGENHFERLIGRRDVRAELEQKPGKISARIAEWTAAPGWPERTREVLLYE